MHRNSKEKLSFIELNVKIKVNIQKRESCLRFLSIESKKITFDNFLVTIYVKINLHHGQDLVYERSF